MILHLVLIFVFGLLALAGIISAVTGLVTKRNKALFAGCILFVIGLFGCFFSGYKYSKAVLEYVKSDEFQSDTKKGTEFIGETIGSGASGLSQGLSNTLDDEAIAKLAAKSGVILGKSIKTVASGLDSTIGRKSVFIDKTLEEDNLIFGSAEASYNDKTNDLRIYLESKTDFRGKLKLTNYDQTGNLIDVAVKEVNLTANKGKVEVFSFNNASLGMTTYYIISKQAE